MSGPQRLVIRRQELATLEIDGREFAVRIGADLDVDVMAEIVRLDVDFRRHGMRKPEKVAEWAERAKRLLFSVIAGESPDEESFEWVKRRSFGASELFQILTFISGNPNGATAEVADALTDGAPAPAEGGGDPTISTRRSRSRRSRSERLSGSGRRGGEDSVGASSGSTSRTSSGAL